MAVGAEVMDGKVDAIYHGGDISYATGYIAVWDFFMDMISPMASGTVYLSTVGNHESDWPNTASYYNGTDSGGECGVMTTTLLPMPAPAVTNQPWWSYDVGLIHFIGISTEHDYTIGSEQYQWLENDLKNVDRTISPWIIFGGHRAMYINSDYGGARSSDIVVMDNMIANLEPLLWEYRVNVGFYGHNHVVNRNAAVYNQSVIQHAVQSSDEAGNPIFVHDNPQATVQMVVGTGGADFTENAVTPPPDWNELFFYEWGYARVTAVNASYLDWEWRNAESGVIVDHMVITQDDPTQPWNIGSTNDDDDDNDNDNDKNDGGSSDELSTAEIIGVSIASAFAFLVIVGCLIYVNRKGWLFSNGQGMNRNLLDDSKNSSAAPVKSSAAAASLNAV
jgi:acid phosphatase type 7